MEKYRPKPGFREYYAPDVTDPEKFSMMVMRHPFYVKGDYRTNDGRREISRRLDEIDNQELLYSTPSIGHLGGGCSPRINGLLTERAVLVDLLLHRDR